VEIPVRGSETEYTPLADSSAILRAIDEYPHERAGPLYPSAAVQDADEHISSVINAYVLYFNHVSSDGWSRSIRAAIVDRLPLGGLLGRVLPLHALYGSARASFRERVKATLAVGDDGDLTDEKMTAGLIGELERYEAALGGEADYLYGSAHPTAADCALHAMVSRFTDGMGDGGLPAALPRMWEVAGPRLSRLRAWQRRMTERHPMLWHRYVAR
jgi:glutathione S-transferase